MQTIKGLLLILPPGGSVTPGPEEIDKLKRLVLVWTETCQSCSNKNKQTTNWKPQNNHHIMIRFCNT